MIVDWGEEGHLACQVMGFVDLSGLPENSGIKCGGIPLEPATHAIVQASYDIEDQDAQAESELFKPIAKDVGGFTNNCVSHLNFYLADVEAIVGPTVVIPDIGGKPNHYFRLSSQNQWKRDFENWLDWEGSMEEMYDPIEDPVDNLSE